MAITDGAILYLDDSSFTYFLHLGILGKLHAAGFRPIVSPRKIAEVNELISYENISGNINEVIERIRSISYQFTDTSWENQGWQTEQF
jgi:hypothetical protein